VSAVRPLALPAAWLRGYPAACDHVLPMAIEHSDWVLYLGIWALLRFRAQRALTGERAQAKPNWAKPSVRASVIPVGHYVWLSFM
jgi:hypothetical protein